MEIVPTLAMVAVPPASTAAWPATWKEATLSTLSTSRSLASTLPTAGLSSVVVFTSGASTLASSTGVMPTNTVEVAVPPLPSLTTTVNWSLPL